MRAYTRTDATDLCALGEDATYMQANTHVYTLTGDLFPFCCSFFQPYSYLYLYTDPYSYVLKKKTFSCFVIRPGHMPSQAPHTSLIMQMRGNVTPQQQMARDDNNGSTDQFQCLRLYRYGNNKNR